MLETFELILGDLSLSVQTAALCAKGGAFADTHCSPYQVRSIVSPVSIHTFVAAIHGDAINIVPDNVTDLSRLSAEFSFTVLQQDVSAQSLAAHLTSEYRVFLSDFDDRESRRPALSRLVCDGFSESASRRMLILAGGNYSLARRTLEALSPIALLQFESATPIQSCPVPVTILQVALQLPPQRGSGLNIYLVPAGNTVYSFTDSASYEYACSNLLTVALRRQSVASNEVPEMAARFFRAQWSENRQHEQVFVMEGLSEGAARKLLMLAGGDTALRGCTLSG
jgi:hypothetical protein